LDDLTFTDSAVVAGAWTPTIAGARYIGNSGLAGRYTRIGDVVTCSVTINDLEYNLDPGETSLFFTLTLPVASNLGTYSVAGKGEYFTNVASTVNVIADAVNDLISVEVQALADGSAAATPVQVMCQYTVI
jgi:hypothetical protein